MADKFWWKNDPAVKAVLQDREDKERAATREATKALDKAHADSQKGKSMSDRNIVGWFYRNGKRIPIFEKKSSEKSALNKAHDKLNHNLGPNELYARVHNVGLDGTVSYSKDVQVNSNPYYNNPDLDTREVETEYGTTKMPLRAGAGKGQLRNNVRSKRKDSYGFPQKRELGKKQPDESYVKRIMKERGLSRADAIKFIKD